MAKDSILNKLTKREKEVLEMFAHGFETDYIAGTLGVAEVTVKTHLQHIYVKLGVYDETSKYQVPKRLKAILIYLKAIGVLSQNWIIDV